MSTDRAALIASTRNLLVLGGPGSGKTTIAIRKADHEIRAQSLKPGQHILFLSFARATIARVEEQSNRIIRGSDRDRLEINTYHGFAWNFIRSHGYLLRSSTPITLLPPPQAASRLAEIDVEMRDQEKQRLFDTEGLLHFDLFASTAARLFSRSKSLARIFSDTYPVIIVDEFQDTNQDEWLMIQALGRGSRLIALADPEQRIYEFRGADPKRIDEFIQAFQPEQFDFGTENHRSNGTDIGQFGEDLLSEANRGKTYKHVSIIRYGFYSKRAVHFPMKGTLITCIKRLHKAKKGEWSLAILVPSKRFMLAVSDYLSATDDNMPAISHHVALDAEAPSLAAALIAGILEFSGTPEETTRRIITDLCVHLRGRSGASVPPKSSLELTAALTLYLETGKVRGSKRTALVAEAKTVADRRHQLILSGDPNADWLTVRGLLSACTSDLLRQVADDAKYLRLLHKGATLRARLGELWRTTGGYRGAAVAVRDALLQEHFSAATRDWRGIHVMTIHKSKGKEFDEVLIYEGVHQGRIVSPDADANRIAQARLSLRVAVTRARQRTTILTPASDVCRFL